MTKIRSTRSSRVQDRRGQGGGGGFSFPGLGGGGGGGGGMGIPMKAGGGILGLILVAAAILLPQLLGGNQGATPSSPGLSPAAPDDGTTECVTELEQIICGASDDVQDYWIKTFPAAFGPAYEETDTIWFTGGVNTACGAADSQVGPFYCPADGLVYFDLEFLQQLQDQFGATGDLAAQYIVAHEYGHHVQNLRGTSQEVSQAQQRDPGNANAYSVALELQADCFAGAWAHDAEARTMLEPGEIREALNAAAAVGDDRIQMQAQGRTEPESYTHGTSEQREGWFRRGFETGDPRQCNTFGEV